MSLTFKNGNTMEVNIKSIHFDATEKLQAFIEKKVAKLEKSFEDIKKVEVQLKVVKPAAALNKEEEGIDLCVDSLREQLTKFKEKLRNH